MATAVVFFYSHTHVAMILGSRDGDYGEKYLHPNMGERFVSVCVCVCVCEGDVIIPVLSDFETASYEPHSVVHGSLSLP